MEANGSCSDSVDKAHGTILLVEDEDFVREVTCEVLRSAHYRVLAARNPREAAELFSSARGQIDLLLTDIVLPGGNGRVLALNLKKQNPAIPVLFVTGYGEQLASARSDQGNILGKPYSSIGLLERVEQLLKTERIDQDDQYLSGSLLISNDLQDMQRNLR